MKTLLGWRDAEHHLTRKQINHNSRARAFENERLHCTPRDNLNWNRKKLKIPALHQS